MKEINSKDLISGKLYYLCSRFSLKSYKIPIQDANVRFYNLKVRYIFATKLEQTTMVIFLKEILVRGWGWYKIIYKDQIVLVSNDDLLLEIESLNES